MRLSKEQAGVIVFLSVVILALVLVILFVPGIRQKGEVNTDPPTDAVVDAPTHDKYRAASQGLVNEIERETRLMGDGDETPVKAYLVGGKTYIFGNATVKGLDFDVYGGFYCIANENGKIASYSYFGENITAVCPYGDSYLVAAESRLYIAASDGTIKDVLPVENVVGVYATTSGAAVVSQPDKTTLLYSEYYASGGVFTAGRKTRIDSGYTLKFFDCYFFGDKTLIAARAYSLPRYDSLVMYTFEAGGDAAAVYIGGSGENITRPYAVMPYPSGYFAVADKNGIATIIGVDYGFKNFHSYSLGFTFNDASIIHVDKDYYVNFERADGAVTYMLDETLERSRVQTLDGIKIERAYKTKDGAAFVGAVTEITGGGSKRTAIALVKPNGNTVSLDITGGAVYAAGEDGSLVIAANGGSALSSPTGTDIYIVKLKPLAA